MYEVIDLRYRLEVYFSATAALVVLLRLPERREGERCRSFVTEESDLHVGDDALDIFHVTRLLGMNRMSEVKVGGEGRI